MNRENLSGWCRDAGVAPNSSGFHERVSWKDHEMVDAQGSIRICLCFRGIRPEDARLYAVYIEDVG